MRKLTAILKERRGLAILLVLCLFALLSAFGASMMLAAQAAAGGSVNNFEAEQARLSAYSMCETIRHELTGTHTSSLRAKVNTLAVGSSYTIDPVTLPKDMGETNGTITRQNDASLVVELQATVFEPGHSDANRQVAAKHTLLMTFTRTESTVPPATPEGTPVTTVTWNFAGYRPKVWLKSNP